jgi:amino-acid N-acetyltransferase
MNMSRAETDHLGPMQNLLRSAQLPTEGVAENLTDYWVALTESGDVVGLIGLEIHGPDGLLRSLVVHPRQRGHGLAARLCRGLLARVRAESLRAVYLLTTDAAEYFARHGFVSVDRNEVPIGIQKSQEFSTLCPVSSVVMRLPLSD